MGDIKNGRIVCRLDLINDDAITPHPIITKKVVQKFSISACAHFPPEAKEYIKEQVIDQLGVEIDKLLEGL